MNKYQVGLDCKVEVRVTDILLESYEQVEAGAPLERQRS